MDSAKVTECKKMAKKLKKQSPLPYCKLLDVAAKEMGFRHFNDLRKNEAEHAG